MDIFTAFTDGGARVSNPGEAAWGFVVYKNGVEVHRDGAYMGIASNNAAEYEAVLRLLRWFTKNRQPHESLEISSDSQLIVNQICGSWKVTSTSLLPLCQESRLLLGSTFSRIHWVPRCMNKVADAIVNEVLDKELKGRNKK